MTASIDSEILIPEDDLHIAPIGETDPFVKVLIYGDPGVGKTVLAAGAPIPLLMDVEHGARSLKNHPELSHVLTVPIRNWGQCMVLLEKIFNQDKTPLYKGGPPITEIKTVIIDTVSELQRRVLDEQLRAKATTTFVAGGKDYQENTERMRRFIMFLRDLPINFVLTCHAKTEVVTNESTGETVISYRPDLTPKLSTAVVGQMDLVGFMRLTRVPDEEAEGGFKLARVLQVHPTERVVAKTRITLPPALIEPRFTDIINANTVEKSEEDKVNSLFTPDSPTVTDNGEGEIE